MLAVAPEPDHVHLHSLVRQCVEHGFSALDDLGVGADLLLRVQLVLLHHGRVGDLGLALYDAKQAFVLHLLERIVEVCLQVEIVRHNVHAFRRFVR